MSEPLATAHTPRTTGARWIRRLIVALLGTVALGAGGLIYLLENVELLARFGIDPQPTSEEAGLYLGQHGQDELSVNRTNWMDAPHNRLALQHVEELLPSVEVERGNGPPTPLPQASEAKVALLEKTALPAGLSLDAYLAGTNADGLLILHDGEIVIERYLNQQAPETRHLMMSVTKSFTGLMAELLINDGVLDPSRTIGDILPELRESGFSDATVRQLMDMEVGIEFDETYSDAQSDIRRFIYSAGWLPWPEGKAAFKGVRGFLASLKKDGEHGQAFQYTTATSEVLGWVIERVGKAPFEKQFQDRIYSKIGAEYDASFITDAQGTALAGGGLNVTLRDLARLALLVANSGRLNGRQIIPAAVLARIRKGGNPEHYDELGNPTSYRSQWYIDAEKGILTAYGIHGQEISIHADAKLLVVQQSSNPDADGLFFVVIDSLAAAIAQQFLKKTEL